MLSATASLGEFHWFRGRGNLYRVYMSTSNIGFYILCKACLGIELALSRDQVSPYYSPRATPRPSYLREQELTVYLVHIPEYTSCFWL